MELLKVKKEVDTNTKIIRQNSISNSCRIISALISKGELTKIEEIQLNTLKLALMFESWVNREE